MLETVKTYGFHKKGTRVVIRPLSGTGKNITAEVCATSESPPKERAKKGTLVCVVTNQVFWIYEEQIIACRLPSK